MALALTTSIVILTNRVVYGGGKSSTFENVNQKNIIYKINLSGLELISVAGLMIFCTDRLLKMKQEQKSHSDDENTDLKSVLNDVEPESEIPSKPDTGIHFILLVLSVCVIRWIILTKRINHLRERDICRLCGLESLLRDKWFTPSEQIDQEELHCETMREDDLFRQVSRQAMMVDHNFGRVCEQRDEASDENESVWKWTCKNFGFNLNRLETELNENERSEERRLDHEMMKLSTRYNQNELSEKTLLEAKANLIELRVQKKRREEFHQLMEQSRKSHEQRRIAVKQLMEQQRESDKQNSDDQASGEAQVCSDPCFPQFESRLEEDGAVPSEV